MKKKKDVASFDKLLEKTKAEGISMKSHEGLIRRTLRSGENAARRRKDWSRLLVLRSPSSKVLICMSAAPRNNTALAVLGERWRKAVLRREPRYNNQDFNDFRRLWVIFRKAGSKTEVWTKVDDSKGSISDKKSA